MVKQLSMATRQMLVAIRSSLHGVEFSASHRFRVDHIAGHDDTGSLISRSFNEYGHLIVTQENGPLLLLCDSDSYDTLYRRHVYTDKIPN